MDPPKQTTSSLLLSLPLGGAATTFNLEKATCSHGFFMMAPNKWDPKSNTFQRPLRLSLDINSQDYQQSVMVRISQPTEDPHLLKILVLGVEQLENNHQEALLAQVRRMFRLSEEENKVVREFQEVYSEAKERGFGRIFRSPTLFEDMVKCILLCNCQWSRTLSMARALCELQLELRRPRISFDEARDGIDSYNREPKCENYIPETPAGKESKRKRRVLKSSTNLASKFTDAKNAVESKLNLETDTDTITASELIKEIKGPIKTSNGVDLTNSISCPSEQHSGGTESYYDPTIGNFPSPRELANLDSQLLASRCNLGYRASRILNLAQSITEGKIQLMDLEASGNVPGLSCFEELLEKLKELNGFGPFTCANVLMCMGFYHVIPTDSETIRHIKQVHARKSTSQTIQRDVELLYGKYKPFQFLVYWSEVWHFYEEWFGKLSEMSHDRYRLITASNMKSKVDKQTMKTRKKLVAECKET